MRSVLILGPGAVGSCLSVYAARRGKEVYLLGRSLKSDQKLISQGISFQEVSGRQLKIKRNLFSARIRKSPLPVSAAFFCVKNDKVRSAARAASKYISPHTPVVFFQNGLNHPAIARKIFNSQNVVIGTCYAAVEKTDFGKVIHRGGNALILAQNQENKTAIKKVFSLLSEDGWDVSITSDEEKMLWTKLCLNAAINSLGALAKAMNGEIGSTPELKAIAYKIMEETLSVAQSCGIKVSRKELERLFSKVCRPDSRQKNSTLQDIEKGKKTEMRQILSPILLRAEKHKIEIPVLRRMAKMIFKLEVYAGKNF